MLIRLSAALIALCLLSGSAPGAVNVLTQHNDNARTGQNLNETILSPANVNSAQFGKLFTHAVDGYVYAQPLYMSGVTIGRKSHNVVFVATESDTVYAFDADDAHGSNAKPLWQVSFTNPAQGITTVPTGDINGGDLTPQSGITATPVIDASTGTLYVLARTKEVSGGAASYVQRLHALDVTSGAEKFGGPVVIQASVPGSCTPNDGQGHVVFDPKLHNARAGLLLASGVVYIAWSSLGDFDPYQGWVMGYNAQTLQQKGVLNVNPDDIDSVNHTCRGGIWQSGAGPAADASGNIFLITGNGSFNANQGGRDFGDSMLRLSASGSSLSVSDYFTPYDQGNLNAIDYDLGSGGPMLLPDQSGSFPRLLVGAGKTGTIYVVNRDNMGKFNSGGNAIVQTLTGALTSLGEFGAPAYFNGTVYFGAQNDSVKAFRVQNGILNATPSSKSATVFGKRGCTPGISANGTSNGILWAFQADGYDSGGPAVLHAYDASNLAIELYHSGQAGSRDLPGPTVKFGVPTIANGKVYVGTQNNLTIYGLLQSNPPTITSIIPASIPAKQVSTLTVNGSNFQSGFTASVWTPLGRFNIPAAALTFVDASQAQVNIKLGGNTGYKVQLTITNPGGLSASSTFMVTAPVQPSISSITPGTVPLKQTTTLTVTGAGFQPGFSATVITPSGTFPLDASALGYRSVNQITANVYMGSSGYRATLIVTNPGGFSASGSFLVQ